MKSLPHKLALYRAAVQHPPAEVAFLHRAYRHYSKRDPLLLKEDFAGTAAVACTWVGIDEDHQAMAVDSHGPTLRWAAKEAERELGERAGDLHFVHADVLAVASPKVDVVIAMNFSAFVYHDRKSLTAYLKNARKSLQNGGIFILDAYGGPGALRPQSQKRESMTREGIAFEYVWEQRSFNAVTGKVDNRIHFNFAGGRSVQNAFRYDWRLWSLAELRELMLEAGFAKAEVWCDRFEAKKGESDGVYCPVKHVDEREDWVAYVVGVRG